MSDSMDKLAKGIRNAIDEKNDRKPKAYDTQAKVLSKDGDILWVHIPGGVDRTPVRRTVDANEGDSVMVRVADGRAWTLGNATNPPTDDSYARRGIAALTAVTQGAVEYVQELSDKDITVHSIKASVGYIDDLYSKNITTENLYAAHAYINDLEAKDISTDDLYAAHAYIDDLEAKHITADDIEAAHAYIDDLEAKHITADDIEADHITVQDLDATYATIETLEANYATINELHSGYAHIEDGVIDNAKIDYADVNDLHAHYAQLDAANISTATIQDAWVDKIMVQSGLVSHTGTIYELDAIQVNASKIKTGTLDVERLIVSVPDQQDPTKIHKYMVHVDPSTGQPSYEKVDADVLEDLTITADKIVAGAITAEKITTANIIGSGGWINLRNGTFEYQNATTGDGITWDGQHLSIRGSVEITSNNYYTKNDVDGLIDDIQDQIDGVIDTWYYSGDPKPNKDDMTHTTAPASDWTTDTDRYNHLRDLYFNTDNGHSFRWALEKTLDTSIVSGKRYYTYNSSTGKYEYVSSPVASALSTYYEYEWIQITDADAIKALADAAKAQETADGKRRVFTAQPTNAQAYDVGDLWVNATYSTTYSNDVLRCKTAKAAGAAFNISHWQKASKYTDDSNVYTKSDFSITPEAIIGKVYAIEDWEIGGRNYCADFVHQNSGSGNGVTYTYNGGGVWHISGTATADVSRALYFIINGFPSLGYGDTYTLSIDSSMPSGARFYVNFANSSSTTAVETKNGAWGASTYTFECNESYRIRYIGIAVKNGATVDFTFRMKLEKGNKATDWSPAPEDTDAKISDLSTSITQTAEAITLEASRRESSVNMLLDSDAPTLTKVYAPANRYYGNWASGDDAYCTASIVEMSDSPSAGSTYAVRVVATSGHTGTAGRGLAFYNQSNVTDLPLKVGTKYTASCWARKTSGSAELAIYGRIKNGGGKTFLRETLASEWKYYTCTVELESTPDYNRLYFYGLFPANTAGTVEMCGFKLVAGENVEAYKSSITQSADKIALVVESGTSASNLELTDAAINAVADNMVIKSSTDNSKTVIQGGKLYADQIEIGSLAGEIGGRNLLLDTDSMGSWYKGSGTTVSNGIATMVGSSSDWNSMIGTRKYDSGLYDGITSYIWSFEYKSNTACSVLPVIAGSAQPVNNSTWARTKYVRWRSEFSLPSSNNKWLKYSLDPRTIAISNLTDGSGDVVSGYLQFYVRTDNTNLQVRHFKLEKGSKATDWSPAPEDGSAVNFVPWPYYRAHLSGGAWTSNGITWTVNKDGSITATGTATANSWYHLTMDTNSANVNGGYQLPPNTYTLSGCPSSGSSTTCFLNISVYTTPDTSTGYNTYYDYGSGITFTPTSAQKYARIQMCVKSGCTCPSGGYTFYPMLEVGGIKHSFVSPRVSEGAASVATSYITRIDSDGIFVSPSNQSPTTLATGNSVKISGDGVYLYKGGVEQAYFTGTAAAIGTVGKDRIIINSSGLNVYNYISSTQKSVASFGSTARIGISGQQRVEVSSSAVSIYDSNNKERTQFNTSGLLIKNANGNTKATIYDTITLYAGAGTFPLVEIGSSAVKIGESGDNYVLVNSSGLQVYQDGVEAATFGSTTRIGTSSSTNINLTSSSINLKVGTFSAGYFSVNNNHAYLYLRNSNDRSVDVYPTYIKFNRKDASDSTRWEGEVSSTYIKFGNDGGRIDLLTDNRLYLYSKAGYVKTGGRLEVTANGNTVTIGSWNAGWCHIYNSESIPFIFNNTVTTTSGNLGTTDYPWGNLYMSGHVGKTKAPTAYSQTCNAVWHKASDSTLHTLCQPTSSSIRYKEDVKKISKPSLDPHNLYDIPVVQFKFKEGYLAEDDPYNKERYDVVGFIAEDVDKHYPIACIKIDGEVENWNERYIIPPMLALIQEQHKEIEILKDEIVSLKGVIKCISS